MPIKFIKLAPQFWVNLGGVKLIASEHEGNDLKPDDFSFDLSTLCREREPAQAFKLLPAETWEDCGVTKLRLGRGVLWINPDFVLAIASRLDGTVVWIRPDQDSDFKCTQAEAKIVLVPNDEGHAGPSGPREVAKILGISLD